jgi:hypothetical protein
MKKKKKKKLHLKPKGDWKQEPVMKPLGDLGKP